LAGRVTHEVIGGADYYWIRTHAYEGMAGRVLSFHQFAWRLPGAVKRHVGRADAAICSMPPPLFARVSCDLSRHFDARFLLDVRDIWPQTIIEMGAASKWNPYIRYLKSCERYGYRHADLVVCALPAAEEYMRVNGLPPGRFRYIPNGVAIGGEVDTDEVELPARHQAVLDQSDRFTVGYAGALGRANVLDALLGAARLCEDLPVRFILVGKGNQRDRLEQLAGGLDHVHVLPPVPPSAIPAVLARYDVCYLGLKNKPIYQHGISLNKLFEYMRTGRPILSAIKAANDPVTSAGCGINVPPEDAEAIAAAVRKLYGLSPVEREKMGARARRYVRENHTYDVLVPKWIAAIEGRPEPDS
jgi:glycosyltransferase involved in cell wall biosynthesis